MFSPIRRLLVAGFSVALVFATTAAITSSSDPAAKSATPIRAAHKIPLRAARHRRKHHRRHRRHHHKRHHRRLYRAPAWDGTSTASWFDDSGSTACGTHYTYGVANKTLACGTSVTFGHDGAVVTAVVEDRGPYVAGRDWDLNAGLKSALGCPDLCEVDYKIR